MAENSTSRTVDAHASAFQNYQSSPWGQLLHKLSIANVQRHIAGHQNRTLRILDVGGGSGVEGISLATKGHKVAILEPSHELLNEARKNAQEAGVLAQMKFYQAEMITIPELFSKGSFDVILCHNVLHYVDSLEIALSAFCYSLVPDGLISTICINRYSEAYRMVLQHLRPDMAYAKLNTNTIFSGVFKVDVRAYTAAEMSQAFAEVGCVLLAQYGLRCVYDYIPNTDLKSDPAFYAELERLEYAMSDQFSYYLLARFFQLIVQKSAV